MRQKEFAALAGVARNTIGQWEKGTNSPTAAVLQSVAAAGVDVAYIITGRRVQAAPTGPSPAPAGAVDTIRIPLFSAVAGLPGASMVSGLITEDALMGEVPISRYWLSLNAPRSRPEALQMVHANGDTMAGTLNSGNFAIVDTDCQAVDGDGIYVLQANGQLFIKRVTRRIDGACVITSDNPSVRVVDILNGAQPVRICGRIVYGWNGRRF